MPHKLDDVDVAIINSLMEDGRKSFRQIAKELSISTPTVQSRYRRLVNLGFIKSISPILNAKLIEKKLQKVLSQNNDLKISGTQIKKGLAIKANCDYCDGQITSQPKVLKFGQYERFFCCTSCRTLYKEKYGARINSLSRQSSD